MGALERMADEIQAKTDCQCRRSALDAARAALASIREPSEAMQSDRVIRQHGYSGDVDMVWRDMVDHILNGGA